MHAAFHCLAKCSRDIQQDLFTFNRLIRVMPSPAYTASVADKPNKLLLGISARNTDPKPYSEEMIPNIASIQYT